MKIDFEPDAGAPVWRPLFQAIGRDSNALSAIVETISAPDKPHYAICRLLTPGRSGASVMLVSYHGANGAAFNWVLKLLPAGAATTLDQELQRTEKYGRLLYPDLAVRVSPGGAVAYGFLEVKTDFRGFYGSAVTAEESCEAIDEIFLRMGPWYAQREPDLRGFFELHPLSETLADEISTAGHHDLLEGWSQLEEKWPKARRVLTTISHGDLNPTNILLESSGGWVLIDFANSGYQHWAADFTRLERQLRFVENPEIAAQICAMTDSSFEFRIPADAEKRLTIPAQTIRQIRGHARTFFAAASRLGRSDKSYPTFEDEYFHMLALQQLRLFGSTAWPRSPEVNGVLHESTQRLIEKLRADPARDYFFGYLSCDRFGEERVLVKVTEGGGFRFPIAGFRPHLLPLQSAIEQEVTVARSTPFSSRRLAWLWRTVWSDAPWGASASGKAWRPFPTTPEAYRARLQHSQMTLRRVSRLLVFSWGLSRCGGAWAHSPLPPPAHRRNPGQAWLPRLAAHQHQRKTAGLPETLAEGPGCCPCASGALPRRLSPGVSHTESGPETVPG
jgi:hypothetical protein